jgi:hypothetical protein
MWQWDWRNWIGRVGYGLGAIIGAALGLAGFGPAGALIGGVAGAMAVGGLAAAFDALVRFVVVTVALALLAGAAVALWGLGHP